MQRQRRWKIPMCLVSQFISTPDTNYTILSRHSTPHATTREQHYTSTMPRAPTPHPLATLQQLIQTPSQKDGISRHVEDDLRALGCMLVQEAGVMLDL
jgi:hypothetical protein